MTTNWQNLRIYKTPWTLPSASGGLVEMEWWLPSGFALWRSFALGARQLIEGGTLGATVMPIAYMQRHALELALKDLCAIVYEIDALGESCARKEWVTAKVPNNTHVYSELITEATAALKTKGDTLPPEFQALTKDYEKLEDGKVDRLRYPTIYVKQTKTHVPSFQEFKVDLVRRQVDLEHVLETHMSYDSDDPQERTLYEALYTTASKESQAATQAVDEPWQSY